MEIISNLSLQDWPYTRPPTVEPFGFELAFDALGWRRWMASNWPLSFVIAAIYILLVFGGQEFMKFRQPVQAKSLLVLWNLSLAFFSFCGFARTFPELFEVVAGPNGVHRSICVRDTLNPSSIFWAFLFTWSKVLELGDTVFLILRKKPIIFLHWYHHLTVLVVCWATYSDYEPVLRWFGVMNLLVHFYMYTYFAVSAMGFRLWKSISISVTIFQISQMVIGILINVYATWMISHGIPCARSLRGLQIHLAMYITYFLLFINYFHNTYIKKKKVKKQ